MNVNEMVAAAAARSLDAFVTVEPYASMPRPMASRPRS